MQNHGHYPGRRCPGGLTGSRALARATAQHTCSQNNTAIQDLNISNIKSGKGCNLDFTGISQTSIQAPNFTCSSNSTNSSELVNQLTTQLNNQSSAVTQGLSLNLNSTSNATAISDLKSAITNNINMTELSSCVQNNLSTQNLVLGNITSSCPTYCDTGCPNGMTCDPSLCITKFDKISQSLTQSAVASCISNNSNISKAINTAATTLSNSVTAENTGVSLASLLGNLFGSLGSSITVIIIIIIIVIIIAGMYYMS